MHSLLFLLVLLVAVCVLDFVQVARDDQQILVPQGLEVLGSEVFGEVALGLRFGELLLQDLVAHVGGVLLHAAGLLDEAPTSQTY